MENNNSEKILNEHRQMLLFSGNISDFQLTNLKNWPYIVFGDELDKVEIHYDFKLAQPDEEKVTDITAGTVSFDLYFKNNERPSDIETQIQYLEIWTKYLFWQDTNVSFKVEGKEWEA